jgi:hypothetical protein
MTHPTKQPEESSEIDHDELIGTLDALFNPEPDEDGFMREWPHGRLEKHHSLTFDYMKALGNWERSTTHTNTQLFSGYQLIRTASQISMRNGSGARNRERTRISE